MFSVIDHLVSLDVAWGFVLCVVVAVAADVVVVVAAAYRTLHWSTYKLFLTSLKVLVGCVAPRPTVGKMLEKWLSWCRVPETGATHG